MDDANAPPDAPTALAEALVKVLPPTLAALYRQRSNVGMREFATVDEAVAWVRAEHGITWLQLFNRTTGKLVVTMRPPMKHEPSVQLRPQTRYRPFGADEKGRYRFELHADTPPFQVTGSNYASRSERDESSETIARLLHLPLDLDVPEED